jgi:hypothetical protein
MMRTLFSDRGRPFFAQADLIDVGPLTQATVTAIVHDGFTSTGRRDGPVAARVVGFAGGPRSAGQERLAAGDDHVGQPVR